MIKPVLLVWIICGLLQLNSIAPSVAQVTPKQNWLQKSYDRVIVIDDDKVAQSDGSYLIDLPIQEKADSNYVFFVSAKIPIELFTKQESFYPKIKEFVLIMPDWKIDQKVAKDDKKGAVTLKPATANWYYLIRRNGNSIQTDSLYIAADNKQPQLAYAAVKAPEGMLKFYRSEYYGSVCCPRDAMRDLLKEDVPFIRDFENKNNVTIIGNYEQPLGKEGEHAVYYTLPNLTTKQRLAFILDKRWQWILNKETKDIYFKPQIFTPRLVPFVKTGFTAMTVVPHEK